MYRARDATLKRDVALPALFTRDPERWARFQREAVLAWLDRVALQTAALEPTLHFDLWVYDLVRGTSLAAGGFNANHVWTPDGKRLIYGVCNQAPQRGELWSVAADASGPPIPTYSDE